MEFDSELCFAKQYDFLGCNFCFAPSVFKHMGQGGEEPQVTSIIAPFCVSVLAGVANKVDTAISEGGMIRLETLIELKFLTSRAFRVFFLSY